MNDSASNGSADPAFRLVYRSQIRIPENQFREQLGAIFSAARSFNKKQRITGALLISGAHFVQTLEGQEAEVRELFARIEQDDRHHSVTVIDTQQEGERIFGNWAMAKVSSDGESDIPLLASSTKGIARAAERSTTPEQDSLLTFMRESADG